MYDPTGKAVASSGSSAGVAGVSVAALDTGTYTVVVADASGSLASTGAYNLYFTIAPGANRGGELSSGDVIQGQIDEGELDSYTFSAQAGNGVALSATATTGALVPALIVYDPTGAETASGGASVGFTVLKPGTYTVVVTDSSGGLASTGAYNLSLTLTPAPN